MSSKFSTAFIFLIVIVFLQITLPFETPAFQEKDSIPRYTYNTQTKGAYMFFEWNNNQWFLADTESGRIWKAIGKESNMNKLEPVFYENLKGELFALPDTKKSNNFTGRYAFTEFQNVPFVIDTADGNIWILKGSVKNPDKLVLIPRLDNLIPNLPK